MDCSDTEFGYVHIQRQHFYIIKLMISQATHITGKPLYTAIICQLQSLSLSVRDNGDVLMSFFEAHFIHVEVTG